MQWHEPVWTLLRTVAKSRQFAFSSSRSRVEAWSCPKLGPCTGLPRKATLLSLTSLSSELANLGFPRLMLYDPVCKTSAIAQVKECFPSLMEVNNHVGIIERSLIVSLSWHWRFTHRLISDRYFCILCLSSLLHPICTARHSFFRKIISIAHL